MTSLQLGVKFDAEPHRCKVSGCRNSAMEGCFREDCPATVECSSNPTGAPQGKSAQLRYCSQVKCWEQAYGNSRLCLEHQIGSRETYILARWLMYDATARRYLPMYPDEPPELVRASIGPKRTTVWLPYGARIVMRNGLDWNPYGVHYYGRYGGIRALYRIDFEVVI